MTSTVDATSAARVATPVIELGRRAKAASRALAAATTEQKNAALLAGADALVANTESIIAANAIDVANAEANGIGPGLVDRLRLDTGRIEGMASGLRQVAELPDPIGEVTEEWTRPNGLLMQKRRVPLGVVAIIYESRPNVTSDAAGLCLKSGNVGFLRGSGSAINSNLAIASVLRPAFASAGLPEDALVVVDDISHEVAVEFMQLRDYVDCLIPRGGPKLIQSILDNATVPFIIDGAGNCHVYVDNSADLAMAEDIVVNGKAQRPSVCNAVESLVVHRSIADTFIPQVAAALPGVELVGDDAARAITGSIGVATDDDFATEYLELKMSVKVVDSIDDAISHINETSTGHSEAIVTSDDEAAERFTTEVDAAAVLVNASTRFVDGEEFGFGAEIGISTQKLHARGPMGLRQLTTEKYVVRGTGQTRS